MSGVTEKAARGGRDRVPPLARPTPFRFAPWRGADAVGLEKQKIFPRGNTF